MDGLAAAGALSVNEAVLVPIVVEPFFVTTVSVPEPEVVLGICVRRDSGGVHETEVEAELEIVPLAEPNLYVTT